MHLKELIKNPNTEQNSKKPNMIVIWLIIIGIVILAFGNFTSSNASKELTSPEFIDVKNYAKEQEMRLEEILKKINGAGDVSVFIRLDDGGEKIPAKNDSYSKEETESEISQEAQTTVVTSGKGADAPYIVKEKTPQITGVLVVARGAGDESVKLRIYEAIKALYGISPHRIQVTY